MSYTELQSKTVTTRKDHSCSWCSEKIERGSKVPYRSYIWDDRIQSDWMHPKCHDAMFAEDQINLENGWSPGDYKRGSINPR